MIVTENKNILGIIGVADALKKGNGKHPLLETLTYPALGTALGYGMGVCGAYIGSRLFGDPNPLETANYIAIVTAGGGFLAGLIQAGTIPFDEKVYKSNLNHIMCEMENYAPNLLK